MNYNYGHSAVVDGSTVNNLIACRTENFLLKKPSYYGQNFSWGTLRKNLEVAFSAPDSTDETVKYLRNALSLMTSILEPYLLYDNLIVDEASLLSIIGGGNDKEENFNAMKVLFKKIPLTERYKKEISKNVKEFVSILEFKKVNSIFNLGEVPRTRMEYDLPLVLKDDVMSKVDPMLFGQSTNSGLRALFYHELAQNSGLPLLLSFQKIQILDELHRCISSDMGKILRSLSAKVLESLKEHEIDLQLPPIAFALISKSYEEDRSLLDVAVEMKSNPEIVSLRKLLKNLLKKEHEGRIPQSRALIEASDHITKRINERSAYKMPMLSSKKLHLSEIPAISTILKIFGSGDIEVPDLILYEKPYVTFYDRWVNYSPI